MTDQAQIDMIMHVTAAVCFTIFIIAVLFFINRVKIAKEKTMQKLLESGKEITPEVLDSLGLGNKQKPQSDFRRGILLIVAGSIFTPVFMFMGGVAWMFGLFPILIGVVYLVFSRVKAARK